MNDSPEQIRASFLYSLDVLESDLRYLEERAAIVRQTIAMLRRIMAEERK